MSIPFNQKLKNKVAVGMVAKSTKKAGAKLVKELRALHADIRETAILHFNNSVPELADRDRQKELLQSRALTAQNFSNTSVRDGNQPSVEFGRFGWTVDSRDGTYLKDLETLWRACLNEWGTSGVLDNTYFGCRYPEMHIERNFADVPFHNFGSGGFLRQAADTINLTPHYVEFHQTMCKLHDRVVVILKKLQSILLQAVDAEAELRAALAPIKNSGKLLELFPEALHHLPEGFAAPKTKQLADPAAINEIRAKLAAGLPV